MGGGDPAEEAERGSATASGGREGGRAGGGVETRGEPGLGAATPGRAAGPARPHRPHGNERCYWRSRRTARRRARRRGGRAGGTVAGSARLGARSQTPATRRRALAGPGLRAETAGWVGRGGAGHLRVCLCHCGLGRRPLLSRLLPARSPLPAPAPLRAQVQVYTMPRGGPPPTLAAAAVPGFALPQGLRTGHPRLPALSPPWSPAWGLRPEHWRARTPTRNNRLPPRPAGSRGRWRGPGPAQATPQKKMAASTLPSPRFPVLHGPAGRGTREAPGGGPRGNRGAGPGNIAQRSSFGHLWLGVRGASGSGRGDGGGESGTWGAHLPAEGRAVRGAGGARRAWLLPAPAAGRGSRAAAAAAAAVAAAPQCGGGAGAGEYPEPGPRGPENGRVGAEGRAGRLAGGGVLGRPLQQKHPLRTHLTLTRTHAPPLGRCRRVLEI